MGDLVRFERLFREHYRDVVRFCRRRLPHDAADDVVSEVFTTTWHRLDDVEESHARAWLFAVARHKVQHWWRADGRRSGAEQRARHRAVPRLGNDPAVQVTEIEFIQLAAARLSPADRELLQLISWEGLSPRDLALVLDCSVNTATVRVHRMRGRLKKHLDALQEPAPTGNYPCEEER